MSRIPAWALVLGVAVGLLSSWRPEPLLGQARQTSPREVMQIGISVVLSIASLFVILSKKYDGKDKHWAYGTSGVIAGFWLNTN